MISFFSFLILCPVVFCTWVFNRVKLVVWQEVVYVLVALGIFVLACIYWFPAVWLITLGSMAMHYKQWLELATDAKVKAYNVLFARKMHVADLVLTVPPKATTLKAEYLTYDTVRIVDQDGNTVAKLEKHYSKHFPLEIK